MKPKIDGFVLAIIAVVIFAYIFPYWGSKNSPIPLSLIGSIGVSLIFFFYGLKLSPDKIKSGLKNWKLHLLVQASSFILFPIIIIISCSSSMMRLIGKSTPSSRWQPFITNSSPSILCMTETAGQEGYSTFCIW